MKHASMSAPQLDGGERTTIFVRARAIRYQDRAQYFTESGTLDAWEFVSWCRPLVAAGARIAVVEEYEQGCPRCGRIEWGTEHEDPHCGSCDLSFGDAMRLADQEETAVTRRGVLGE